MKRRNFMQYSALGAGVPLAASAFRWDHNSELQNELYEIRTYEIRFGGRLSRLVDYLQNTLRPALLDLGVRHFLLFDELGLSDPKKIWSLISYPDAATYLAAQHLHKDESFLASSSDYDSIPLGQNIYNRFSSCLLMAFDGMPQMKDPLEEAGLFELRVYEGYSEDAVRRKIKMFDVEEIDLFLRVGLYPVFFGDMISGPHRPSLVYMLNFENMEERDQNWRKFLAHPEWNTMKAKDEYANTVSNIRKTFLTPM